MGIDAFAPCHTLVHLGAEGHEVLVDRRKTLAIVADSYKVNFDSSRVSVLCTHFVKTLRSFSSTKLAGILI